MIREADRRYWSTVIETGEFNPEESREDTFGSLFGRSWDEGSELRITATRVG